jgi:hypothetical protein
LNRGDDSDRSQLQQTEVSPERVAGVLVPSALPLQLARYTKQRWAIEAVPLCIVQRVEVILEPF